MLVIGLYIFFRLLFLKIVIGAFGRLWFVGICLDVLINEEFFEIRWDSPQSFAVKLAFLDNGFDAE